VDVAQYSDPQSVPVSASAPPPATPTNTQPPDSDSHEVIPAAPADSTDPSPDRPAAEVNPPKAQSIQPPVRKTSKPPKASKTSKTPTVAKPSESAGEPPIARMALSLVGMDDEAEMIWVTSINDPQVPPEARKNLIEDLNEDGFPDPKNMTPDDVPLILNRMAMIEDLAPDAMDDVNAAAFAEAYKDLNNMLRKAQGG
jgi:hypothetical protein